MKQFNVFLASLTLTGFAFLPAAAYADDLDDLEVTMEVIDSLDGVEDVFAEMPGPEGAEEEFGSDDSEEDFADIAAYYEAQKRY